jgi:hypothetical protein
MSEFIVVPRKNISKAIWDIKPANFEVYLDISSFLDLRFLRKRIEIIEIRSQTKPEAESKRIWNIGVSWKKLIFLTVIALIIGGMFWSYSLTTKYIFSKKAELINSFHIISDRIENAVNFFENMELEKSKKELNLSIVELNKLEENIKIALFFANISEKILPGNDYFKAVLLLHDLKTALKEFSEISEISGKLLSYAPKFIFSDKEDISPLLESLNKKLENASSIINEIESHRSPIVDSVNNKLKNKLPEIKSKIQEARNSLEILQEVFGMRGQKTILLMFQNPAEIRATGGFVGSYGILKIDKGKISEFRVDDIYNPDGQLSEYFLPPRPLRRVTPTWGARDANWFFDFGLSARKTIMFLQKTTGISFDMAVALNPKFIQDLLAIVGPVEMPEYYKTITSENFWEEAQYQTRAGEDRKINQPKKFLVLFGPRLLERFQYMNEKDLSKVRDVFLKALSEKDLIIWAKDPKVQAFVEERNWDGNVESAHEDEDYLAIVMTNIGGAKADYVMIQNYYLQTQIDPSGNIVNTLRITRTHNGYKAKYPWWRARNFTYIRVFVPKNSALLYASGVNREPPLIDIEDSERYHIDPDLGMTIESAIHLDEEGVDIFEESGKTVFGFWHIIDPGQSKTITLRWQLPFKAGFSPPRYAILFQSQSGVDGVFQHMIELPKGSKINSVEPAVQTIDRNAVSERFSWVAQETKGDIRHALSYQIQ